MAPIDELTAGGTPGALSKYIDEDILRITEQYDKLWEVEDPEENPYKSKYQARELLQDAVKQVERLLGETEDDDEAERGREMLARLFLYLGKNYYYCEEVAAAERQLNRSLELYLRSSMRLVPNYFVFIQDVLNQLGMLWCHRQNHAEGMNFLRRAQIMFLNRPAAVRETHDEQADNNYTLTMFYLAQAYGGLQKPALSARFCAETMSRQLEHNTGDRRPQEIKERDPFDCKDWVRNCCSLSDFFANECMFWTAEYLLHAAAAMCEKCKEICGIVPESIDDLKAEVARDMGNLYATRLKFARTCTESPAVCEELWRGERKKRPRAVDAGDSSDEKPGSRLTFRCAADMGKKGGQNSPIVWDAVFPEVVYLEDEEAQDNQMAEEVIDTGADASAAASPGWIDLGPHDRVRLPVYFARLHAVAERRIRRANAKFLELRGRPALVDVSIDEAEAQGADSEAAENAAGGDQAEATTRRLPSCAGTSFEVVREIFKLGNKYFLQALSHFLLDGWVTEHVRILQELSQLYRTLSFWEQDPKRVAAMLTRRTRMLSPLLDQLNPKVYIAFWRQLSFEAGEIFQETYDLKAFGKMPGMSFADADDDEVDAVVSPLRAARCNELAKKAIDHYKIFIDSYNTDGKVPNSVGKDDTRVYLTARLNRARLSTKMKGLSIDDNLQWNKRALREYEWILDYACRNPEVATDPEIGMAKEIQLSEEMASMLPSKLNRIASKRR